MSKVKYNFADYSTLLNDKFFNLFMYKKCYRCFGKFYCLNIIIYLQFTDKNEFTDKKNCISSSKDICVGCIDMC